MKPRTLNEQTSDAKVAFQVQSQRLKEAEDELILARVRRPLSESRIHKCEAAIRTIQSELEKLKELQKSLDVQKVDARKRQKNIEVMILEQVKIANQLKTESAALFVALKSASAINERILALDGKYFSIKDLTGKSPDRSNSSSGFHSLRALVEILEAEVAGRPRSMFHFPPRFPV